LLTAPIANFTHTNSLIQTNKKSSIINPSFAYPVEEGEALGDIGARQIDQHPREQHLVSKERKEVGPVRKKKRNHIILIAIIRCLICQWK
jgi:hypothetical protein